MNNVDRLKDEDDEMRQWWVRFVAFLQLKWRFGLSREKLGKLGELKLAHHLKNSTSKKNSQVLNLTYSRFQLRRKKL